jgi:hypothetical protein
MVRGHCPHRPGRGTTLYLGSGGAMAEQFTGSGGAVTWTNYLVSAGGLVGMHVENVGGSTLTRYFNKDHLGSVAVITDESGTVLERLSFDAWGKRRYPTGADDPAGSITSQTNRGFTGHEELDAVGLVHMNGRVYDPLLALCCLVATPLSCSTIRLSLQTLPAHVRPRSTSRAHRVRPVE